MLIYRRVHSGMLLPIQTWRSAAGKTKLNPAADLMIECQF